MFEKKKIHPVHVDEGLKGQAATRTLTCAGCASVAVKGHHANAHMLASNSSHCPLAFPSMQMRAGAL